MNSDGVGVFLEALGAENVTSEKNGWVRCSCPLAVFTHEKGTDNTPSFGVKISDGASKYNCYSCGSAGSLIRLINTLWVATGIYPREAAEAYAVYELGTGGDLYKEEEDLFSSAFSRQARIPVPQEALDTLPLITEGSSNRKVQEALRWLSEVRGISVKSTSHYGLRCYCKNSGPVGVVFPISSGGVIYDLYIRFIDDKSFYRCNADMLEITANYNSPDLVFGVYDISKPVIVTEAPLDVCSSHTLGVSNIIAHNGGPRWVQQDTLQLFHTVILGYDADPAGKQFQKLAIDMLDKDQIVYTLDWSIVGAKDCGDLKSRDEYRRVIKSAQLVRF